MDKIIYCEQNKTEWSMKIPRIQFETVSSNQRERGLGVGRERGGGGGWRGGGRERLIQEEHKHLFHEGTFPSFHFRGKPNTCSNATDTEALN